MWKIEQIDRGLFVRIRYLKNRKCLDYTVYLMNSTRNSMIYYAGRFRNFILQSSVPKGIMGIFRFRSSDAHNFSRLNYLKAIKWYIKSLFYGFVFFAEQKQTFVKLVCWFFARKQFAMLSSWLHACIKCCTDFIILHYKTKCFDNATKSNICKVC